MPNNRMLLVHKRTGRAVILAKWLPAGWWPAEGVETKLKTLFDEFDGTDWNNEGADFELVYESDEGFRYAQIGGGVPLVVDRAGK